MPTGVLVLVLMSAAPLPPEERGVGPSVVELRSRMRPSFVATPALTSLLRADEFGVLSGLGFGLSLELGLVALDRMAFSLEVTGSSLFPIDRPLTYLFSGGPTFDWFLNDHWTLGTGARLLFGSAVVLAPSLMVPIRASWRLADRGSSGVTRQSFVIGLQLGFGSSFFRFVPTFSGLLTVGYGWW